MPIALGLALTQADPLERLELSLEAEARGCESLWLETRSDEDALAELAVLARATTRVRLGVLGHGLAARHPLVSAREIADLDRATHGRTEIGLGGAHGAALEEAITVCKKLWCDPAVEHRGAHFELEETALSRPPLQRPWPRLHLGGDSEPELDRAARVADGWLAFGHSPVSIAATLARLRSFRARAETLDGRFQVSARAEPRDLDELARWREAGVDRLIVSIAGLRALT